MGVITSSDAVLMLTIAGVYNSPVQLQGFATDDIYDIPTIRSVETMMGVDGVLSGGFVFAAVPQEITLQADSLSNQVFDDWWKSMQANKATYPATGLLRLPGVATKFTQSVGFLTGYKPAPAGKRVLQPRRYEITWQSVVPSPA